jgi:hypothetical protein
MDQPLPPLPPLKTDPKYGHYPWWPQDGDDWVHPEDVALARAMIPSPRVWRREGEQGEYVVLQYGDVRLRVKRTLWVETPHEGYDIGDWVEVRPRGMTNDPVTGQVRELHWDAHAGVLRYYLTVGDGAHLDKALEGHDLKPVEPPKAEAESRIEPSGEYDDVELQEE